MPHNPEAVQQWASQVMRSPYWKDVKEHARHGLLKELIEAAHESDHDAVHRLSWKIRTLDDVIQSLGALSTATSAPRKMHETVIDDAE